MSDSDRELCCDMEHDSARWPPSVDRGASGAITLDEEKLKAIGQSSPGISPSFISQLQVVSLKNMRDTKWTWWYM